MYYSNVLARIRAANHNVEDGLHLRFEGSGSHLGSGSVFQARSRTDLYQGRWNMLAWTLLHREMGVKIPIYRGL